MMRRKPQLFSLTSCYRYDLKLSLDELMLIHQSDRRLVVLQYRRSSPGVSTGKIYHWIVLTDETYSSRSLDAIGRDMLNTW